MYESGTSKKNTKTDDRKGMTTPTRFELARAEPIGFQNQLLNHSDTVSLLHRQRKKTFDSDEI